MELAHINFILNLRWNILFDILFIYLTGIFCDIVDGLEEACLENNILDIWNYNKDVISKLSKEEILNAINTFERSNLTRVQYTSLLGQVSNSLYNFSKWVATQEILSIATLASFQRIGSHHCGWFNFGSIIYSRELFIDHQWRECEWCWYGRSGEYYSNWSIIVLCSLKASTYCR